MPLPDSNPQSQQVSGRRHTSLTARPLGPACKSQRFNIHPEASNWTLTAAICGLRVATVQFVKFSGGNCCRFQLLNRGLISNTAGTKQAKVTSRVGALSFRSPEKLTVDCVTVIYKDVSNWKKNKMTPATTE